MKLRDRLLKTKSTDTTNTEEKEKSKSDFSISDIFADSKEVREYIVELAQNKRNMILISNKSFDKIIIADYFKAQLRKTNARTIGDIDSRMDDLNGRINIVPNPDIHNVVKILEQIIYGCQSFIIGANLGEYDNIINKLKVLIALNYKNLTQTDIITLIGSMKPVIVYVSKNSDGLFFISQIDEIKLNETYTDLEISTLMNNTTNSKTKNLLKEKFSKHKDTAQTEVPQVSLEEEKEDAPIEAVPPTKPDLPDEQISLQYRIDEAKYEADVKEKKLNKYQLLKEKARQKRLEEQDINQKV